MNDQHPSNFSPESLMMSYGFKPELSEGAVKAPIFQTSTFVFKNAEAGKAFFELAYGLREKGVKEEMGLIYSRLNNPNLEILEDRLKLWDKAEACAVFESGLAAISTVLMEFTKPGDLLLYSGPLYGGTDHFIKYVLTNWGVNIVAFDASHSEQDIIQIVKNTGLADRLSLIYIETPANPTNALIDFEVCANLAKHFSTPEKRVYTAVDNTYMGPVWQHPLQHGMDLVLYSATKYIGGHSDVVAGACLASAELITRVKILRTFLGNMAAPMTCWLLARSLETMKLRMDCQCKNAQVVALWLSQHPKIDKVYYLGLLQKEDPQYAIYQKQCTTPGAMISFDVKGGEAEAFKVLNNLKLVKLAVSLGGTESLAEHPHTMTHADVTAEDKKRMNITEKMVRLSVGVENPQDLIRDLEQALAAI